LGVVLVLGGCATTPKWASGTTLAEEKFPSREEIATLAQRPPKLDTAKLGSDVIESWGLAGPFPETLSARVVPASSDWEQALVSVEPRFAKALTEDHRCLAREIARYLAQRKQFPGHSLQRFIEFRCATTARHVSINSLSGTVPKDMKDAEWLAQWKADLGKYASRASSDLVGIAAQRDGEHAVVVLVTSEAGAILEQPVPLTAQGTKLVEVRGRLGRGGAQRISARINQGALDSADCRTLDAVAPPQFAFECAVKEGDTRTVIEVAAFDEGRILGRKVIDFVVWPTAQPSNTWARAKGSVDVPNGLLGARFIAEVNAMRARASLPLLTEVATQSKTATALAPHYFAASFGQGDPLDADEVALAMLAGWEVNLDTVSSGFGNAWVSGTRDLSLFMEYVLDSPFQRHALTDPRATHIAVGPYEEAGSLAAIFATYVPLKAFDRKESEIAIITRLNTMRRDRGLPLAQWTLWPSDEGEVIARKLASRAWDASDASHHALEATAEVAKGRVVGYVQLVDDLDHFQFPPEVLMRPDINVFLAVGTYRAPTWAQTRYVVCFVLAKQGDIETARR
jgi:hypothetical protein